MRRVLMVGLIVVAAVGALVWAGGDGNGGEPSPDPTREPSRVPKSSAPPASPPFAAPAGRIAGYVRDVNGHPVPGATVRLADGRRLARTNRAGRYELPGRRGRQTVVAARRGYTRQSVATVLRHARGARVDFSLAVAAPDRVPVANSADRLILWTGCNNVVAMSETELQRWIDRGVDGFVCQTGLLPDLGGSQRFSAERRGRAHSADTRLQRELMGSAAGRRARQGRLLLYLGFFAVNYFNRDTPFVDWFDNRGWSRKVLPRVHDLAAAAKSMGFAGLAIDQELYPQKNGARTASWSARYSDPGRPEARVRSAVKRRGRQLMQTMVRAYPGLELLAYDTVVPESWYDKVQAEINDVPDVSGEDVRIDLWDGLSSVQGYSAIRWLDATFYKTPHIAGASWDTALEYNANRIYSYLSRRFSNWTYASSRLHVSPFSWVNEGPASFERARDPDYVAEQLDAFRRWGAGGLFANYSYGRLGEFDYSPYDAAFRHAGTPGRVDASPPKLSLRSPAGEAPRLSAGKTIDLDGIASDDFAIRAVRWRDDRDREGVARLTWNVTGDERDWKGSMDWSIDGLRIRPGTRRLTITAEDIHGLASELELRVRR